MKVCVLGAGVVGCATAFELAVAGHEVTLLDASREPGMGTSFANGAQLSYSYVEPLANPDTFFSLPKLLLSTDSPVQFRMRFDIQQWLWGAQFLLSCTRKESNAGSRELLALGALSRQTLDAWIEQYALEFSFQCNGKLVLCADAATLRRQERQLAGRLHTGVAQYALGRSECISHEPALTGYRDFVGGIWTPSECLGDPHMYCKGLVSLFHEFGGRSMFNTEALEFEMRSGRAMAVRTTNGSVEADAFVLATGISSRSLATKLSERLPIYPIKGYSMTLALRPGAPLPRVNVTDLARKMVLAPLNGALRVAAMAEVGNSDLAISPDRIEQMICAVEKIYPGLCQFVDLKPWAGLRPATPNSVPIIRPSNGARNVILNVGHGALGFTLAAGSAKRVGQLL